MGRRTLDTGGEEIWGKWAVEKQPLFLEIIILGRDLSSLLRIPRLLPSGAGRAGGTIGDCPEPGYLQWHSTAFQRLQPQPLSLTSVDVPSPGRAPSLPAADC